MLFNAVYLCLWFARSVCFLNKTAWLYLPHTKMKVYTVDVFIQGSFITKCSFITE